MKCIVKNYRNYQGKKKLGISFHRLPKCKHMEEKWLSILEKEVKNQIHKRSLVCSAHFDETCFMARKDAYKRRILKDSAVPSLFRWDNNCENVDQKNANINTIEITPETIFCGLGLSGTPLEKKRTKYSSSWEVWKRVH